MAVRGVDRSCEVEPWRLLHRRLVCVVAPQHLTVLIGVHGEVVQVDSVNNLHWEPDAGYGLLVPIDSPETHWLFELSNPKGSLAVSSSVTVLRGE